MDDENIGRNCIMLRRKRPLLIASNYAEIYFGTIGCVAKLNDSSSRDKISVMSFVPSAAVCFIKMCNISRYT